ncbi:hypothetical protein ACFRCQ_08365 [Cytobacillus firmus]
MDLGYVFAMIGATWLVFILGILIGDFTATERGGSSERKGTDVY